MLTLAAYARSAMGMTASPTSAESHWMFCREHKTRWCIGSNLFSSWRHETEAEQRAWYDKENFGSYETVEPYHAPAGHV
jgi:hypothetical protein